MSAETNSNKAKTSVWRSFHLFLPKKRSSNDVSRTCKRGLVTKVIPGLTDMSIEQIVWLREYSFKWVDIAKLLGIFVSSLNRWRYELRVSDGGCFTTISDDDLDSFVREISSEQPFSGVRIVRSMLDSRRIHERRERVRMWLYRVDPVKVQLRRNNYFGET